MKRFNILDLFMPHKLEIDVHYGLQNFRPLHNFINLFINHHSGCPNKKDTHLSCFHLILFLSRTLSQKETAPEAGFLFLFFKSCLRKRIHWGKVFGKRNCNTFCDTASSSQKVVSIVKVIKPVFSVVWDLYDDNTLT